MLEFAELDPFFFFFFFQICVVSESISSKFGKYGGKPGIVRTGVGSRLDRFFGIRTFKGVVPLRKLRQGRPLLQFKASLSYVRPCPLKQTKRFSELRFKSFAAVS